MAEEFFFSICKPDAVRLNLVGEIIRRFEQRGLRLIDAKWTSLTREQVTDLYLDKQTYGIFPDLLAYMTSGPVVVTAWQGENANAVGRQIVGEKEPADSMPGSIRGSLPAVNKIQNLVHGSRSPEEAWLELQIAFPERWNPEGSPVPASARPAADAPYAPGELAAPPPLMKPWLDPWEEPVS